ncbi:MAG: Acetyltransferase domain [Bacteroidota bacterium]|nr:Acetyltransferase domain [Bacteroidota bacterium]
MIQYSKQESEIFEIPFGRLNIEEGFTDWDGLKQEVAESGCQYIRVKIKNPGAEQMDHILALSRKVHLLEILRVYRSEDLLITPFENAHSDLIKEKVNDSNKDILEKLIYDTYDDIPFGNFTPANILKRFPTDKQLKGIIEFFKENYAGQDKDKVAYIYFNENKKPVGCVVSDYFNNGPKDCGTYSYYVGVARDERNKGIQFKIVNFIKFYVTERGYSFLDGSTRLSNLYSARTMEKNGCKCTRYDWIYLLEK